MFVSFACIYFSGMASVMLGKNCTSQLCLQPLADVFGDQQMLAKGGTWKGKASREQKIADHLS